MRELIHIRAEPNYSTQWVMLKKLYVRKRGSDRAKNHRFVPRTTNGDVAQLAKYWHGEFLRAGGHGSKAHRMRWIEAKNKIDRDLKDRDPAALYPHNEWFWQEATSRVSLHLNSAGVIPSATRLVFESVAEQVEDVVDVAATATKGAVFLAGEATDALADAGKSALTDAGKSALSVVKTGALITAGVVGAAIVLPPVIRAIRKD